MFICDTCDVKRIINEHNVWGGGQKGNTCLNKYKWDGSKRSEGNIEGIQKTGKWRYFMQHMFIKEGRPKTLGDFNWDTYKILKNDLCLCLISKHEIQVVYIQKKEVS